VETASLRAASFLSIAKAIRKYLIFYRGDFAQANKKPIKRWAYCIKEGGKIKYGFFVQKQGCKMEKFYRSELNDT
jgi:hypothetical protein